MTIDLVVAGSPFIPSDPWTTALRKIRGEIGYDGVERIDTGAAFEQLDLAATKTNTGNPQAREAVDGRSGTDAGALAPRDESRSRS